MAEASSTSGSSRAPSREHARLIAGLVATAILLVGLDRLGGWILGEVYQRSTASPVYRIARAQPHTLILGSSTGKYALDPAAFPHAAYNAAENGEGAFYVGAVMRNLRPSPELKRIIFALDPGQLIQGYRDSNMRNLWRYAPLGRDDAVVRRWLAASDPLAPLKFLSALFPYRGLAPWIVEEWRHPSTHGNGYSALTGSTMELVQGRRDTPAVWPWAPLSPEGRQLLREIADAADRLEVQMIVLVTPVFGRDRADDPRVALELATMRRTFSRIDFCDLTTVEAPDLPAITKNPSYYYDGAHLNRSGASVYSRLVSRLLRERC